MAKLHFHPEADFDRINLMGDTPLHKTNTDNMNGLDCIGSWDLVDCKICLKKKPAHVATYMIRSASELAIGTRKAHLAEAGFNTSEIREEAGGTGGKYDRTVYVLRWDSTNGDPQKLTRTDDRWSIANTFFQRAAMAEGWDTGYYAKAANDWSAFGYKKHSLEAYLDYSRP